MKKEFSWDDVEDSDVVKTESWRHGYTETRVFRVPIDEYVDEFWKFSVDVHHEDGWQRDGDTVLCTRVLRVPVQTWKYVER